MRTRMVAVASVALAACDASPDAAPQVVEQSTATSDASASASPLTTTSVTPAVASSRQPPPRPPPRPPEQWMVKGHCRVPDGYRPWSWSTLHRVKGLKKKAVIFTVDGGHSLDVFHAGLDVLREHDVRATYFLTTSVLQGDDKGAALLRRLVEEGHELGNHTLDHLKLSDEQNDDIRRQIDTADQWVEQTVGRSLRPFFRAPFLDRSERVDRLVRDMCYRSVWISLYTRDDEEGVTANQIANAVLRDDKGRKRKIKRGSILLFHASQPETVKAWPRIIGELRARGYAILPLGEAMRSRKERKRSRH